jgi:parallel beta-helix repeat protein
LIVVNSGVAATLQDLNVQHGAHSGGNGGGIYNSGDLTLTHVVVSGNTAMFGGGIFNEGNLGLYGVFISGNSATAGHGGGLFNDSPDEIELSGVTVSNNTASDYSGGIHQQGGGGLQLTNVTISGNTAHIGGAMTVTAIALVAIEDSTIANNHKDAVAGSAIGGIADYGTVNMESSILYGNDDANCGIGGSLESLGYNIDGGATCLTPAIAQPTDHPSTNPLLGPLAKNGGYVPTQALLTGSPAIDAGTANYCNPTDAAGWKRPQDGNGDGVFVCDIGAFEAPTLAKFTSAAAYDGWVRESTETSNVGGAINTSGNICLGDSALKQQYRGILSFATGPGLPDTAVITGVTLKVKQQAIVGGGNPVSIFGGFMADIKNGFFGTASTLQTGDFQAAASQSYGPFALAPMSGWYSINLTSGKAYVNKLATGSGLTQIRLRFKLDDNNNAVANYLSLYSGNAATASRPQLVITYYAP